MTERMADTIRAALEEMIVTGQYAAVSYTHLRAHET